MLAPRGPCRRGRLPGPAGSRRHGSGLALRVLAPARRDCESPRPLGEDADLYTLGQDDMLEDDTLEYLLEEVVPLENPLEVDKGRNGSSSRLIFIFGDK